MHLTRRDALRTVALGGLGALLAACGQAVSKATGAAAPTGQGGSGPATPRKGGKLVLATSVGPPNLDPQMEISDARMRRSVLMYDTLVEWNDDLTIGPGLAESYDTSGTKWVFHLRRGAEFSNGKEVQAEDVIYSLQRVLASPGKGFYSTIDRMTAPDKYTVELDLKEPSAPLLAALGGRYAFIIPRDGDHLVDLKQTSLGSGPFQVKDFVENQHLVLTRNAHSWQADKIYLDEIEIRIIPDESTTVAALRSGDVQLAIFANPKMYLLTKQVPDLVSTRSAALDWDIICFPLNRPPFDNLKVRQAIALALDRQEIMQAAINGLGTLIAEQPATLWGALPVSEDPFFTRDVAHAKQLLSESGVATPLQLTLYSIVGYAALNAAAEVIVENLKDVGIQASIQQLDLGVWISDLNKRDFPTFTMNSWGGWIDPDILYYNHLHERPQGADFWNWHNAQISALLDKGRTTLDHDQRVQIYLQVQKMCVEQVPWLPLYSGDIVGAHTKMVRNFRQHPTGYYNDLRYVWLAS